MNQKTKAYGLFIFKHLLTYPIGFVLIWMGAQEERVLVGLLMALSGYGVFTLGALWAGGFWTSGG